MRRVRVSNAQLIEMARVRKPTTPEFRAWHYKTYQKPEATRRRRAGKCLSCEAIPEINPRTGKPYVRCKRHRDMMKAAQIRWLAPIVAERLRLGLCRQCGNPAAPFTRCMECRVAASRNRGPRVRVAS